MFIIRGRFAPCVQLADEIVNPGLSCVTCIITDTKRTLLKVSLYAKAALGRWNQGLKLETQTTRMETSHQTHLKVSLNARITRRRDNRRSMPRERTLCESRNRNASSPARRPGSSSLGFIVVVKRDPQMRFRHSPIAIRHSRFWENRRRFRLAPKWLPAGSTPNRHTLISPGRVGLVRESGGSPAEEAVFHWDTGTRRSVPPLFRIPPEGSGFRSPKAPLFTTPMATRVPDLRDPKYQPPNRF